MLAKHHLLLAAAASAVVFAAPQPEITPRAVLPRADYQTLGWYSSSEVSGATIYSAWEYDHDATTYSTSGQWFRRCPVTATCTMYTACSNGYLVAAGTSSFCGAGGASGSLFCSNHVLYTTSGASQALSWYWCDTAPLTGYTFYATEPANAFVQASGSSAVPSSASASTTASDESSSALSGSDTASSTSSSPTAASSSAAPQPAPGGSDSHAGAIAGGVVGGVAVLGAIIVGILFLLRRNKRKNAAAPAPSAGPPAPGMHQQHPQVSQAGYYGAQSPPVGYAHAPAPYPQEQKPQGVVGYSQGQSPTYPVQEGYPQALYDPHISQQYGGTPPPVQGSPNQHQGPVFGGELPANSAGVR